MNATTKLSVLAFLLTPACFCGCAGSSPDPQGTPAKASVFEQVAGMLRDYTAASNRGPAKAADLALYETGYPFGYQAVRSGDIVVVWGGKMGGEGGGGRAVVIAYEKKVLSEGGYVLLENGTVKQMSAAEFNAAPKAGK